MKFTASTLFIASVFGTFVAAIDPVCSISESAPFKVDCQIAVDGLSDTTPDCGTSRFYASTQNSALSCTLRTHSVSGKAHCLDRALLKAATQKIIDTCTFNTTAGLQITRSEGIEEIVAGSGDYVSVEWSNCGGGCHGFA